MAISEKAIQFLGNSLEKGRPVPGQSLTNSPEEKYNWEKPSEFTNVKEATLYVFEILTVPETVENMLMSVSNNVGIVDIASIVLYSGFLEGKWNPDVMTLLMEPTMFMIMALAEKAQISYILESGDNEKAKEMDPNKQVQKLSQGVNELDKLKQQTLNKINPQVIPEEIKKVVEETEIKPSLLEKIKKNTNKSLLSKEV